MDLKVESRLIWEPSQPLFAPTLQKTLDLPSPLDTVIDMPKLKPPPLSISAHSLKVGLQQLDLTNYEITTAGNNIDENLKRQATLRASIAAELETACEKNKAASSWGVLADIAAALSSVTSIIMGIAALSTGAGAFIGAALIATGVATLGNLIATKTGLYNKIAAYFSNGDKAKQKEILKQINRWMCVGLVALSIISFGAGLGSGTALKSVAILDIIVNVCHGAAQVASGVSALGKGYTEYIRDVAEAEAHHLEDLFKDLQLYCKELMDQLREWFESEASSREHLLDAFKDSEEVLETSLKNTRSR